MATSIVSRVINSATDQRVKLSNSEIARAFDVGTGWNAMRIGVRLCAVPDVDGVDINGTPRLNIGISAGSDDTIGVQTPEHFVGARSNEGFWQLQGTDPDIYERLGQTNGMRWQFFKNVDGVETHDTAVPAAAICAEPTGFRSAIFVDINKNLTGSFDLHLYGPNDAGADDDMGLPSFFTAMETPSLADAGITNYVHSSGTAGGIPVDEGDDGALNTLNIYWDRTVQNIEISDVAYSIFR